VIAGGAEYAGAELREEEEKRRNSFQYFLS
jgi:hypothetical protein